MESIDSPLLPTPTAPEPIEADDRREPVEQPDAIEAPERRDPIEQPDALELPDRLGPVDQPDALEMPDRGDALARAAEAPAVELPDRPRATFADAGRVRKVDAPASIKTYWVN